MERNGENLQINFHGNKLTLEIGRASCRERV